MTEEPWAWALRNDRGEAVHGCIGRERTVKLAADDLGQGYIPVPVYLHPIGGAWFVRLSSQNAELRAEIELWRDIGEDLRLMVAVAPFPAYAALNEKLMRVQGMAAGGGTP